MGAKMKPANAKSGTDDVVHQTSPLIEHQSIPIDNQYHIITGLEYCLRHAIVDPDDSEKIMHGSRHRTSFEVR